MQLKDFVGLIYVFCFLLVIYLILFFHSHKKLIALRSKGLYPKETEESEDDVLRLIKLGEFVFAVRCYRSIHKVSLKEAKKVIEKMKGSTVRK